jgi:hypothetical protein
MAFDTTARIVITGEAQGLEAAMNKAHGVITQRTRDIEGVLGSASRALAALGAGLSVTALAAFTRSTIDAVAALDDMAETTGMSVENLSRWRQIARISGTEMGSFEAGVLKLSRALAGADEESKGAAEAFKAIGLSVAELKRMSPDEQFEAFAKAMNSFADGANKTAIGQAILGRQWRELAPLMKDYAEAGQIAANVTAEQAAQAEKLQKEWNALALSAQNLAQSGLLKLVSAFQTLRKEIADKGVAGTIRDIIDPQSELSLQAQIADLRRKQSGAKSDREFAELESEIVAVQARLAEALRLKRALTGDDTPLPQAPGIAAAAPPAKAPRAARSARADTYVQDVFGDSTRDVEKLFAERAEMLEKYGLAGSKKYMEHLKEEVEFQRWAERELYQDQLANDRKIAEEQKRDAEEMRRQYERVEDSLTDALLEAFENGKDAGKAFADTLKSLFASLVLRPIIQPIAQAGANIALGALGMGASGSASASDIFGIGSAINGITGGAGIGGAVATGLEALGASTGVATGWGAFAGAAAPWAAAALLAYSMLKPKRGGPKSRGDAVGSWQADYARMVEQLGGTAGSFSPYLQYESDPAGTASSSVYAGLGGAGVNYQVIGRDVGRDEAQLQAALAEEYTRMLVLALQASDLPEVARKVFDAIDPATASAEQLASALAQVQEQAQQVAQTMSAWGSIARNLAATRLEIATSPNLAMLSPEAQLYQTGLQFSDNFNRSVLMGDQASFNTLGQTAKEYLTAARGYYASSSEYSAIYGRVQKWLEEAQNAALKQADMADLISELKVGNSANEAGLSALLTQLQSIDKRLASIETNGALAAAA